MQPIAYTRKQVANMLWISEQWVNVTKKVIRIQVWSARSKKYVTRYLLKSDLEEYFISYKMSRDEKKYHLSETDGV